MFDLAVGMDAGIGLFGDFCADHFSKVEVDVRVVSMKSEKVCCCLHCLGA